MNRKEINAARVYLKTNAQCPVPDIRQSLPVHLNTNLVAFDTKHPTPDPPRPYLVTDAWNLSPQILGGIAVRTLIVYAALVIGVRAAGKRQIAQLTPFDLVVLLLLSNAVQNAMTGPDTSVTGGLVAALTLLLANWGVSLARLRWPKFRRFAEGVPIVLVSHGQVNFLALRHEQMTEEELMAALREHEVSDISQVELATLEVDGEVSTIRRDPKHPENVHFSRKKLVRHHMKH